MKNNGNTYRPTILIPAIRVGLILVFLGLLWEFLPDLKIDNTIEGWAPGDSGEIADYEAFVAEFGSDALIVVAIETGEADYDSMITELQPYLQEISAFEATKQILPWPLPFVRLEHPPDEDVITYLVSFDVASHLDPLRPDLLHHIDTVLARLPYKTHIAGTGVFHREINHQTQASLQIHLVIGMILLLASLIVIVRSPKAILLVLLVSVGGVLSMLLTAAALDIPVGMIHTVLPLLILFYGTSVSLHILFHRGDFRKVLVPTLLAGLTTCIGFSVFLIDDIPLLQDFSLLSVGGILGSFLWALVLFFPQTLHHSIPDRLTRLFRTFPLLEGKVLVWILCLMLLISIPGALRLKADIFSLDAMPRDAQAVSDHLFIETKVGNYFPVECILDRRQVKRQAVKAWVDAAIARSEIDGVISYYQFPLLSDPREFGYRSKRDRNLLRITFLVKLLPNSLGRQLISELKILANDYFESYVPVITGYVPLYLYGSVTDKLAKSFVQSLVVAFGLIFLIIALHLRNGWLAGAAFVANALPILLCLGIMGWMGIYLDMVTVPVGCLLLGIVVDDTIHFMYWYHQSGELAPTFLKAGPGIFYTSLLLMMGFVVMISSPSPPVMFFGLISVVAILSALASDLVFLPALLQKLKDLSLIHPP